MAQYESQSGSKLKQTTQQRNCNGLVEGAGTKDRHGGSRMDGQGEL
jgi:hypothetical protein